MSEASTCTQAERELLDQLFKDHPELRMNMDHDGFYLDFDELIGAMPKDIVDAGYNESPMEMFRTLIDQRDEARAALSSIPDPSALVRSHGELVAAIKELLGGLMMDYPLVAMGMNDWKPVILPAPPSRTPRRWEMVKKLPQTEDEAIALMMLLAKPRLANGAKLDTMWITDWNRAYGIHIDVLALFAVLYNEQIDREKERRT